MKSIRSSQRVRHMLGAHVLAVSTMLAGATMAQAQASPVATDTGSDITVTARRQQETTVTVPESISAFGERSLARLNIQSFNDYATKVPNLSFSYGTGGLGYGASRTIAIRGISGPGTTAFYLDDTPIPSTVDPQVVDIQRIEVLKGPRGTLFGEGSLGGNVRLITNRPSFKGTDFRFNVQAGGTVGGGSPDYQANGVANFVLVPDRIAVRVVGFGNHEAGFVTRTYPLADGSRASVDNQGAHVTYGGSASLLFDVTDNFKATARIMGQESKLNGLPVAYAPLPDFKPTSYTLDRQNNIQEYSHERWMLPSLELNWELPGVVNVTSSTSYFWRHVNDLEDGTEGTTSILQQFYGVPASLGANGYAWKLARIERRWNQEVRAAFEGNKWINGVVGARYADNYSNNFYNEPFDVPGLAAGGYWPTDLAWYSKLVSTTRDVSVFGEAYLHYSGFELTLGLRQFWLKQGGSYVGDGLMNGGLTADPELRSRASGLNPKAALSYKFGSKGEVYASASKGFRAGGPNLTLGTACNEGLSQLGVSRSDLQSAKPDSVWNYEVGAKAQLHRLTLSGAAFQMDWHNIQQSVTVPVCYITVTANAGSARVRGLEFELTGEVLPGVDIRLGLGYNDARITQSGLSGQTVGSRVYQVPKFTGVAAATYTRPLTPAVDGFISADYSYTGNSLSGTTRYDGGSPIRASYGLVNGRIGVRRDKIEVAIYGKNLTNAKPNLGDINPVSYVRQDDDGNPIPRVALLHPMQFGVQLRYGF